MQDDRELKRVRRKQSNRESARRSRQKKQAECEDLGSKVQLLDQENASLRQENLQLRAKLEVPPLQLFLDLGPACRCSVLPLKLCPGNALSRLNSVLCLRCHHLPRERLDCRH